MLGDDIKSAQTMLDGLGLDPGRKDGYFDKQTENALKEFQTGQKMEPTGVLDAKTAEALESSVIKQIRDPKNDLQLKRAVEEIRKEIAS